MFDIDLAGEGVEDLEFGEEEDSDKDLIISCMHYQFTARFDYKISICTLQATIHTFTTVGLGISGLMSWLLITT